MSNSSKTKILSLLLFLILAMPMFFNPVSQGRVMGIVDEKPAQAMQLESAPNNKKSKAVVGQIAGGVIENKAEKNSKKSEEIQGMALLQTQNNSLTTDKYNLATSLKVTHEDNSLSLVVNDTKSVLDPEAVITVNQETFEKLGGNPETQDKIPVTVNIE